MRTSKPIATISYNTEAFLIATLEELYRNKKICDWCFIKHYPEEDEKKEHIHLWVKPNTLIDTMDLQEKFKELDLKNPTKPLGCIDFRSSNIDDFILYGMHLEAYLLSKLEFRQYHYEKSDFKYCDEDTFNDLYNHALKGSEWAKRNQTTKIIKETWRDPASLIDSGILSLNQAPQLNAYTYMKKHTYRNGRKGHEDEDED